MNFTDKIKSLLTGGSVEESHDDEPKRNPFPNGPVTYKTTTNGQVRRSVQRAKQRKADRAFRAQRRNYLAREAERAALRGMLQALGVVAYHSPEMIVPEVRRKRAEAWVEERYGDLATAVLRYEALSGEKVSA